MTYSLAITGYRGEQASGGKTLTLSDANAQNGSEAAAMSNGTAFLCRGVDGVEAFYQIDASRSIPGGPVYLLRVGP